MATTVTLQRLRPDQMQAKSIIGAATGNLYLADSLGRVTVNVLDAAALYAEGYAALTLGSGGGSAPSSGTGILSFGPFPGSSSATVTLVAAAQSDPNAVIDCWIVPIATADHSVDEHQSSDAPIVSAVASGANIIITGYPSGRDLPVPPGTPPAGAASQMPIASQQLMPYGAWTVGWAFAP
jgi:hypothetical protein